MYVLSQTLRGGERSREMEGMREIARSYFETASEDEKNSVQEFFTKLDVNGDGKIRLEEIKRCVNSWLCTEDVFKELDVDGNEALNFDQVLCLYYMEKKVKIVRCSGCFDLLVGSYFSCTLCLGNSPDTYDLCCSCYRHGNHSHHHSSNYLLDHHSLITLLRDRTSSAASQNSQRKKEMEELREIAKAHYEAASPQVQALAYHFYQSMDSDGDGRVSLSEFQAFMRHEGYSHMHNPYFFDELDHDGNGTLDFFEVMTLFYIIKSGRPFCQCCARFIPGIFFSCVDCFKNPLTSFNLCRDCYRSSKCGHNHNGVSQFLDNYTLLNVTRDPALAQASGFNSNYARSTSSNAIVQGQNGNLHMYNSYPPYNQPQNQALILHPNPIVQPSNRSNWRIALSALEFALNVGSMSGGCTIM